MAAKSNAAEQNEGKPKQAPATAVDNKDARATDQHSGWKWVPEYWSAGFDRLTQNRRTHD